MGLFHTRFEGVSSLKKKIYIYIYRIRCREEIDAFVILLCLSNKLIPKRIKNRKSDHQFAFIATQTVYWVYIVGEIWEDAYKVSFADFWSSVGLPHL